MTRRGWAPALARLWLAGAALIAVAETPDYSSDDPNERWIVDENHVAVFDEERRIEIYRKLDRMLHRPGAKPIRQDRTWRFRLPATRAGSGLPSERRRAAIR